MRPGIRRRTGADQLRERSAVNECQPSRWTSTGLTAVEPMAHPTRGSSEVPAVADASPPSPGRRHVMRAPIRLVPLWRVCDACRWWASPARARRRWRGLAGALDVRHVELDSIFHQPGWTELPDGEFRRRVGVELAADGWVVDGNYAAVRDVVWAAADTVVWMGSAPGGGDASPRMADSPAGRDEAGALERQP